MNVTFFSMTLLKIPYLKKETREWCGRKTHTLSTENTGQTIQFIWIRFAIKSLQFVVLPSFLSSSLISFYWKCIKVNLKLIINIGRHQTTSCTTRSLPLKLSTCNFENCLRELSVIYFVEVRKRGEKLQFSWRILLGQGLFFLSRSEGEGLARRSLASALAQQSYV